MTLQSDRETLVLWAIDPFAEDLSLQRSAAWVLKDLSSRARIQIQPVFLESETFPEIQGSFRQTAVRLIRQTGQEELNELTGRMRFKNLLPLAVLTHPRDSLRERTQTLLEYAQSTGAQMIVASTHARKGPARWLMGSFAETLSLASPLPLLFVNPKWNRRSAFDRIVFATDFSSTSRRAFEELLPLAAKLESKVTLFHQIPSPMAVAFEFPAAAMALQDEGEKADREWAQSEAKRWKDRASELGVRVTTTITSQRSNTLAQAVCKLADQSPGVIALATERNAVEATLLGSTSRQIIRGAACPVWVMRPPKQQAEAMEQAPASRRSPLPARGQNPDKNSRIGA